MIVSTFKSINKAYVDLKLDMDWDQLADLFLYHYDAENKHDVELYNMAEFKDNVDPTCEPGRKYHYIQGIRQETYDTIPNTTRRCKNNVISLSGVVLDIDENHTIDETIELLDGIEYILYTTFRHTPEKHKFRVVIPFSRPLLKEDIEGRKQSIIDTLPSVDNCSFTVSQSFYFHSGKCDSIAFRNHGIMIDPYDFEYTPVVPPVYQPYVNTTTLDDDQMEAYKQSVVESLLSCSGLHYAGTGDNNKGVLTLVSICKSIGLSFGEYDTICARIAHPESQLVKQEIRRMAWSGWAGDKVRRETRDNFIKAYNGIAIKASQLPRGPLTARQAVSVLKRKTFIL
jgi:hypothetical protein